MYSVTIGKDISRAPFGGSLYPNIPYLYSRFNVEHHREYERTSGYDLLASVEPYTPKTWQGENTGSLLVFNDGKIGDQLWTTALVHEIKRLHPRLEIDVVTSGESDLLWYSNKDIRGCRLQPVPIESLASYDYTLFFDEITASQMHEGQPNCYEALFEKAGLRCPPDAKPYVRPLHDHELSTYMMTIPPNEEGMIPRARFSYVIGLDTSSEVRNLSLEQWMNFVVVLSQNTKSKIYCLSSTEDGGYIAERLNGIPNVIPAHNKLNLLQIAALCKYANCVIAPDSMLVHLAASQEVPCVAIMSTVPPKYRISSYPYCVPIWKYKACQFEECFYKHPKFQFNFGTIAESAKCYTPTRVQCDVMKSVTLEDMFDAVNLAMSKKKDRPQEDLPLE